ncbi:MAG: hypothetical protein H0U64_04560 [Gemmatimonadaceae bacterium]|nr:hypothetical protein [Gemmatimonadaceae bacterium]
MDLKPIVAVTLISISGAACSKDETSDDTSAAAQVSSDSSFAAVQARGEEVMGVDQYTSKHVFKDLPDGGSVGLNRDDAADTVSIAQIRAHMLEILADFKRGDFSKPFHVHNMKVPGTDVMKANASKISYTVVERPTGAELQMITKDSATLAAIHTFLKFQREDHRAGEHDM